MNERFKQAFDYLTERRRIYSAADLSRLLGVTKSYLSEVLNGKRTPSPKFLLSFSQTFPEISSAWLLNGDGRMLNVRPENSSGEKGVDWEAYRRYTAARIYAGLLANRTLEWTEDDFKDIAKGAIMAADVLVDSLKNE